VLQQTSALYLLINKCRFSTQQHICRARYMPSPIRHEWISLDQSKMLEDRVHFHHMEAPFL